MKVLTFDEEKQKLIEASELSPKYHNNIISCDEFNLFINLLDELNAIDKETFIIDITRKSYSKIQTIDEFYNNYISDNKEHRNLISSIHGTLTGALQNKQFAFIEKYIIYINKNKTT
jgi:hypothetical protein